MDNIISASVNGLLLVMMAKFFLNDMPHVLGLSSNPSVLTPPVPEGLLHPPEVWNFFWDKMVKLGRPWNKLTNEVYIFHGTLTGNIPYIKSVGLTPRINTIDAQRKTEELLNRYGYSTRNVPKWVWQYGSNRFAETEGRVYTSGDPSYAAQNAGAGLEWEEMTLRSLIAWRAEKAGIDLPPLYGWCLPDARRRTAVSLVTLKLPFSLLPERDQDVINKTFDKDVEYWREQIPGYSDIVYEWEAWRWCSHTVIFHTTIPPRYIYTTENISKIYELIIPSGWREACVELEKVLEQLNLKSRGLSVM